MTTIGNLIREARSTADMTQRQVAKALGYKSVQNVSGWERGRTAPPPHAYRKLCKTLDIPKAAFKRALVERYEKQVTALLN